MRGFLLVLIWALSPGITLAHEDHHLTVYTYGSFASEWGPGPRIQAAFEATCECELELVAVGGTDDILKRLASEGEDSPADVVVGINADRAAIAEAAQIFAPHRLLQGRYDMPLGWHHALFVPIDWGYVSFIYDKPRTPSPPSSFRDLAASEATILIQDPRSSAAGLALLLWVKAAYGDESEEIWRDLADNIVEVTEGWSASYGQFLEGGADMVLSYTTSPAYHVLVEGDRSKAAAQFDEGHYMQIELAGVLTTSNSTDLAHDFVEFLMSDQVQALLPESNWMYPARMPEGGIPEEFGNLISPSRALFLNPSTAESLREEALREWLAAINP
ncbi:MAG: thiamine ABC transporter substrate-binding protein [Rhodobacteraceae bacterium]|nr:thiamine ABC transporter substrate-binding protein [Paracoccaceae bacterium]